MLLIVADPHALPLSHNGEHAPMSTTLEYIARVTVDRFIVILSSPRSIAAELIENGLRLFCSAGGNSPA
ncbi:UNVERIFIED_ORG: hypothetical protein ABIC54_006574 [Burkholderia sp. 1263]